MTERMSDERLAEIDRSWSVANISEAKAMLAELLYGMEAERERAEAAEAKAKLSHDMFIGAMADIKSMEREIEAAEAKLEAAEKHNEILAAANRDYMTKLEAMKDIEEGWNQCNYNEQDCLDRILNVLNQEP